ncbi:MAG: M23 family metallopeptidase [Cyanobacteriota bacterium]|nr:M23 family metallopeptidase [Cyanobacteriota bacterium]
MPWVCSETRRRRHAGLLLLSLAALLWGGSAARANPLGRWALGSFPVVGFNGYTSPFGLRVHPISGDLRAHEGLDIAAPLGSPVRSWWAGRIQQVLSGGGCGNGLVIVSGPYEHLYCHLGGTAAGGTYRSGRVLLRQGQWVRTGQLIGHVGLTGSTTGPHLHWGLRYRGALLDPARVLRAMAEARRRIQPLRWRAPNVGQLQ